MIKPKKIITQSFKTFIDSEISASNIQDYLNEHLAKDPKITKENSIFRLDSWFDSASAFFYSEFSIENPNYEDEMKKYKEFLTTNKKNYRKKLLISKKNTKKYN